MCEYKFDIKCVTETHYKIRGDVWTNGEYRQYTSKGGLQYGYIINIGLLNYFFQLNKRKLRRVCNG